VSRFSSPLKTIPEFNGSTGIHDENASDSGQIILMISFSQSLYLYTYNAVNAYSMDIVRLQGIPPEKRGVKQEYTVECRGRYWRQRVRISEKIS
jgi:hypothetical protein